jgi:hypothetical protein
MKDILFRLRVAAALTLAAFALSSSAHGQQADEDATPTNATSQGKAQQSSAFSETQTRRSGVSSSPSDQIRMNLHLPGALNKKKGSLLLKDPVIQ